MSLVLIMNPNWRQKIVIEHGGEGSAVAVPVAEEVLQWWAQHRLNVTSTVDTLAAP